MTIRKFFVVSLLLWSNAAGAAPIGDRLIMEVNNTAYSQRQIEAYLVLKDSLRNSATKGIDYINAQNWPDKISEFKIDVILDQEALRLGGFNPSEPMLKTAQNIFNQRQEKDAKLREFLQWLSWDDKGIQRTITSILRIESFRRNKDKQAYLKDGKPQNDASVNWVADVVGRAAVRIFEGAANYQVLNARF